MKLFTTLLLLAGSLSAVAYDAQIITSTVNGKVTIGFSDSSFDYAQDDTKHEKNFCYTGRITEVCKQLAFDASVITERYLQGAHDDIQIKSCEVVQDMDSDGYHPHFGSERIVITYALSDDYGSNFDVTRVIRKCSKIN